MKKYLTAFILTAVALSTMAQYQGPGYVLPGVTYPGGNNLLRNAYSSGANNWGQNIANTYSGSWAFDQGIKNETQGGSATFTRGSNIAGNTELYLYGNVSGYFAATVNNSGALSGLNTKVVADPEVVISSSKRAIMMRDNHGNNNSLGNWTFEGGTYIGGANSQAMLAQKLGTTVFDSVAFYAGSSGSDRGLSAVDIGPGSGGLTIRNTRGRRDIEYVASTFTSSSTMGTDANGGAGLAMDGSANISGGGQFTGSQVEFGKRSAENIVDNLTGRVAWASGGSGAAVSGTATINGGGYNFMGGDAGSATAGGDSSTANAYGGHGAAFGSGSGTISNSTFRGASARSAKIVEVRYLTAPETYVKSAINAKAYAFGGSGLRTGTGTMTLSKVQAYGASGGSAVADGTGGYADASGGNGVYTAGSLTVNGGYFEGRSAGNASSRNGQAYAIGGNGILAGGTGTITLNRGTFIGSNGGSVTTSGSASALGGAGAYVSGGTLNINGGTYRGGAGGSINGEVQIGNIGVAAVGANLNISESSTNTTINGNVYAANNTTSAKTLNILGGKINGDIYSTGTGIINMTVNNNADFEGDFTQRAGTVNVALSSSDQGRFFKDVLIENGTMTFTGSKAETRAGSHFALNSDTSALKFNAGVELGANSSIQANYGDVTVAGGNMVLGANSTMSFSTNFVGSERGSLAISGDLVMTNKGTRIRYSGIAADAEGTVQLISAANVVTNGTDVNKAVSGEFGWLTKVTDVDTSGGITVSYGYRSLAESTLGDLNPLLIAAADNSLTNDQAAFFTLNADGAESGTRGVRYSLSQMADVADAAFRNQMAISEQLAIRSTQFRTMNGFASSRPASDSAPYGAAGPGNGELEEKTMQGWIRGYNINADRGVDGNFTSYDSTTWGTMVGIDKNLGNLLVGVAGGYSHNKIDANGTYDTESDIYHGSIYSTFGWENIYVDGSATYAHMSTTEDSVISDGDYDGSTMAGYIGTGIKLEATKWLAITPAASFLATYYDQDSYTRNDMLIGPMAVDDYNDWSYLSSLGVNFSTLHHFTLFGAGIGFSPEIRTAWLHEFNDELDDGSYRNASVPGVNLPLYARTRESDLYRLGFGIDLWSWNYSATKFELDYDGIFSSDYDQHMVSGKLTVQF